MAQSAPAPTPAPSSIALGAYIKGAPGEPTEIYEFAKLTGKRPSVVMWMQPWGAYYENHTTFRTDLMDSVVDRGATPMVMWGPANWNVPGGFSNTDQPDFKLNTIYNGDHDAYIRQWARDAKAWNKRFYLRFAWEGNGYWFPWSPNVNGNGDGREYVRAWRHVYKIFQEERATNAKFVWSANVDNEPNVLPFSEVYPGDAYVDWVGLDGYNRGGAGWKEFKNVFTGPCSRLSALTTKPMMITETASVESGGSKADWIRRGLLTDIATACPRARAVNWWHSGEYQVDSSDASLAAYKEVVASPPYQGSLP